MSGKIRPTMHRATSVANRGLPCRPISCAALLSGNSSGEMKLWSITSYHLSGERESNGRLRHEYHVLLHRTATATDYAVGRSISIYGLPRITFLTTTKAQSSSLNTLHSDLQVRSLKSSSTSSSTKWFSPSTKPQPYASPPLFSQSSPLTVRVGHFRARVVRSRRRRPEDHRFH
jgi:hypothetical protein